MAMQQVLTATLELARESDLPGKLGELEELYTFLMPCYRAIRQLYPEKRTKAHGLFIYRMDYARGVIEGRASQHEIENAIANLKTCYKGLNDPDPVAAKRTTRGKDLW